MDIKLLKNYVIFIVNDDKPSKTNLFKYRNKRRNCHWKILRGLKLREREKKEGTKFFFSLFCTRHEQQIISLFDKKIHFNN